MVARSPNETSPGLFAWHLPEVLTPSIQYAQASGREKGDDKGAQDGRGHAFLCCCSRTLKNVAPRTLAVRFVVCVCVSYHISIGEHLSGQYGE